MEEVLLRNGDKPAVNIVVVELHHHAELIRNLYEILKLSHFKITLITLPDICEQAGLAGKNNGESFFIHLKFANESMADFMLRMAPAFQVADILYFNTIRHYWRELNQIPFGSTSIVRIHNAHCDLAPLTHFDRPIVNCIGILSHLVRKVLIGGEWRKRKRLFEKIDYFMFPNQSISDYIERSGWVPKRKILPPVLPFGFLGSGKYKASNKDKNIVTIAITGKVTGDKKDFNLVYLALKKCLGQLSYPIKLILLGKAEDKHARSIIEDYQSLESDRFILDYSEGYVSSDVFEEKMASVDFLIAPIQVKTHFRKYFEIYGKSKMSGIENDILLYLKPSLVVSMYPMTGPLENVVDYFEPTADSLAAMLAKWVNERTFDQLEYHFDKMTGYERRKIADNFYELCQDLLRSSE